MRRIAIAMGLAAVTAGPALACGVETDCVVADDRTYRVYLPDTEGPMGAIVHAHGYRGSAQGSMRNAGFRALADRLGMAFVALDSEGDDWNIAHRPAEPDQVVVREYDYVRNVLADLASRTDLDESRLISTGFSSGGMMTWTLICGLSDRFAGFVPYAGTFWAPVPATCATPAAPVIHIHGTTDTVVPLAGRPIGPGRQGDVLETIDMYAAFGGFGAPVEASFALGTTCTVRTGPAGELSLCLFDGGHSYSIERVEWAIERILGPS